MDFEPTVEQQLLTESASRFLADTAGLSSASRWAQMADMGWLALAVPEDCGGLGNPLVDLALLCEVLGAERCEEPLLMSAILPARVLTRVRAAWASSLLADIASGSQRVALALREPGQRYGVHGVDTLVCAGADGGYQLAGKKLLVVGGAEANALLVSARLGDRQALVCLRADQNGVDVRRYLAIDGTPMADLQFDAVRIDSEQLHVLQGDERDAIELAMDEAAIGQCADLLGGMDRVIELTAGYLGQRRQFGKALAEFQALQHQVAELFIEAQDARSMLYRTLALLEADPGERPAAVAACVIKIVGAAKRVTGAGIHLHGGIGVTCEYPVGHYLRRVMVAARSFGDEEHYLQRYLEASAAQS